jgi:hypothetical protein
MSIVLKALSCNCIDKSNKTKLMNVPHYAVDEFGGADGFSECRIMVWNGGMNS